MSNFHETYVQSIRRGKEGYFAVCMKCGSSPFPDRATRAEAEADGKRHEDEHAPMRGVV